MRKTSVMKWMGMVVLVGWGWNSLSAQEESLPPLKEGKAPQSFEEMWAGYDPRKEPIETEILKECEEDGVVMRVIRYRIGVFKGQKAMMAAVYGFPKGGTRLPGLLQIHGGGQSADYRAVLTNGKRGYATLSLAWSGRVNAPGYVVTQQFLELFWQGKTNDPNYKVSTDWGALDAYLGHRDPNNHGWAGVAPRATKLDAVVSPRNVEWFMIALAARRGLTFLEQQPEVNPEKLGVYGHSMGGKLTVLTAASDSRIRAAAPSCGGMSDRYNTATEMPYRMTINDGAALRHVSCPIIFLSPSNDCHGRIDDLSKAVREIASKDWRVTCSPHSSHWDHPEFKIAGPLWFDQQLKGTFQWPKTPVSLLELKTPDGVPVFSFTPDDSKPILEADIYYTYQGQPEGEMDIPAYSGSRFWHHAAAVRNGKSWTAKIPILSLDRPLWVYGNVLYALEQPVTAAGYGYEIYTAKTFNVSSAMAIAGVEELKKAGAKATLAPSLVIETFETGWQKEWFQPRREGWGFTTFKVHDPAWAAPENAKLALEVKAPKLSRLSLAVTKFNTQTKPMSEEGFNSKPIQLEGGSEWQHIVLDTTDFTNSKGSPIPDWSNLKSLQLQYHPSPRATTETRAAGQGSGPEIKDLRWVK